MPTLLKKLLINVLLKRGSTKFEEFVGKKIRHGMTIAGGWLMAEGLIQPDDVGLWQTAIGGAVALGGIVLSDLRLYVQDRLSD